MRETCRVCHETMEPRYVPDSVYPNMGYFACVYCGSMVTRENSAQSASKSKTRRVRDIILITVVATPAVVALIAIALYLL